MLLNYHYLIMMQRAARARAWLLRYSKLPRRR